MKQRATEELARKEAEESEKIERQVQERMAKERESLKLNPSIELKGLKSEQEWLWINYVII